MNIPDNLAPIRISERNNSDCTNILEIKGNWPKVYPPNPTSLLLTTQALKEAAVLKAGDSVLDLGTGSGIVAINIARHYPKLLVNASDISELSCKTARQNSKKYGVTLHITCSDWLSEFSGLTFDLITAHPPAVPYPSIGAWGLSSEMEIATNGGIDGTDSYFRIAEKAKHHLSEGGKLLLGIPHWANLEKILKFLNEEYSEVSIHTKSNAPFFPIHRGTPSNEVITRTKNLVNEGHINIDFDSFPPISPISVISALK